MNRGEFKLLLYILIDQKNTKKKPNNFMFRSATIGYTPGPDKQKVKNQNINTS